MMRCLHVCIVFVAFVLTQASNIIYLQNCTYSIELYQQYLNLLWSSNDSRTLHIQAVYSLSSNHTFIPGHIYTHLSQTVSFIPFFVQCKYPADISSKSYLSFTQCSSTITKKNYESTRTYLNLKTIFSMTNVPSLHTGEYNLLLSNCSFRFNSNIYQLKPNDLFKLNIEYENSINNNITSCSKCNKRTSICHDRICVCRTGTTPIRLYRNYEFCVDTTPSCSYDVQRCLSSKSIDPFSNPSKYILLLVLLIAILFILFLLLLWCLLRNTSKHTFNKENGDHSSNQSIFTIYRNEQHTPSTISTTDSIKPNDYNCIDQHILANEYVSTLYEEYPKIISNKTNAEVVLILA